jgi:hypothetical protein
MSFDASGAMGRPAEINVKSMGSARRLIQIHLYQE